MHEIREDLKELARKLDALVVQGAEHNVLLKQHEARSLALQEQNDRLDKRVQPVEEFVKNQTRFYKTIGGLATSALGLAFFRWVLETLGK